MVRKVKSKLFSLEKQGKLCMVSTGGAAVGFSSEMKSRAPQLFPSRSSQWTFVSQFSHVDDGHQSSQI